MTSDKGFDRLIAFSDAVVAIAMTLLVLALILSLIFLGIGPWVMLLLFLPPLIALLRNGFRRLARRPASG